MSFLKRASPSRATIRRSSSLPGTCPPNEDSPSTKEDRNSSPLRNIEQNEGSLSPEWQQAARAQLEIQALASSTFQAAACGCFYVTPVLDQSYLPESKPHSPASPNSPLLWDLQLHQFMRSPLEKNKGWEALSQIPKDELVPGTLYSCTWWDSRNSGPLVRGRVAKFLLLDPVTLATQLHELSSYEPAFMEGGPHQLVNLVDVLWTMARNASVKGTVLPGPETGYCHICVEMGRSDCYNPFHARELPDWWQRLRDRWDGEFEKAMRDGGTIDCMFFCGTLGCLNPVACQFRHDHKARRRICQETGRLRRRATFGSTWMAELGLDGLF